MRCPKCSFHSFDYNDVCPKCGKGLDQLRTQLGLFAIEPQVRPWLAGVLGEEIQSAGVSAGGGKSDMDAGMLADYDNQDEPSSFSEADEEIQLSIEDDEGETLMIEEDDDSLPSEGIELGEGEEDSAGGLDEIEFGMEDSEDDSGLELSLDSDDDIGLELNLEDDSSVDSDTIGEKTMKLSKEDLEDEDEFTLAEDSSSGDFGSEDELVLDSDEEDEGGFDPNSTMVIEPEDETMFEDEDDSLTLSEEDTLSSESEDELSLDLDDLELNLDEN